MNSNRYLCKPLLLAACVVAGTAFTGCVEASRVTGAASAGSALASGSAGSAGPVASATAGAASAASPWQSFASDFKTVEQNPLNEAMQYELWLAASAADAPATEAPVSELAGLAEKYLAIVADKGVHYVETNSMFGMKTEYWIKGGKFKKVDPDIAQVTVFDGESYVQYKTDEKTGTRYTKEMMAADIVTVTKGMLASMASAPFDQQKDAKVGKYTCAVFHLDIDILGMKGSTLYVDKATGMLVKTVMGDPKGKNSITTTVESFQVGGFGDDVFTVPKGIVVTDYQ